MLSYANFYLKWTIIAMIANPINWQTLFWIMFT